jgi:hypothetical protein
LQFVIGIVGVCIEVNLAAVVTHNYQHITQVKKQNLITKLHLCQACAAAYAWSG